MFFREFTVAIAAAHGVGTVKAVIDQRVAKGTVAAIAGDFIGMGIDGDDFVLNVRIRHEKTQLRLRFGYCLWGIH